MPRKPRKIKVMKQTISPALRSYLETGIREKGDVEVFFLSGHQNHLRAVWEAVKDEIMDAWLKQHPCSRPFGWWKFDAPPKSRLQISGKGQTTWEKWPAVLPSYERGLPSLVWIDDDDPPVFESETAYFDRLELLTPKEKTYLLKHPGILKPERVIFDKEEI